MKTTKIAALTAMIALVLFLALPNVSSAAEDGAALYKAKCSACHGVDGAGKPPRPGVKGADEASVKAALTKVPHVGIGKNLNEEQVKAIATYVKGLK